MEYRTVATTTRQTAVPNTNYRLVLSTAIVCFAQALASTANANTAIDPTDNGLSVSWQSPSGAPKINVHQADGTYIETLSNNTNRWTAPSAGGYYFVTVTGDDWTNWLRSNTINLAADSAALSNNDTNDRSSNQTSEALADFELGVVNNNLIWSANVLESGFDRLNIFNADGSYVTTVQASTGQWPIETAGSFYADFINGSDWRTFRRSNTVQARTGFGAIERVSLDDVGRDLLHAVAGYQSDQLAPLVVNLASRINPTSLSPVATNNGELVTRDTAVGDEQDELRTPITRYEYNCSRGGTMVREFANLRFDNPAGQYSHSRDQLTLTFNQCAEVQDTSSFGFGNFKLNGTLLVDTRERSGFLFSDGDSRYSWSSFSLNAPEGVRYEVDGDTSTTHSARLGESHKTRTAALNHYRKFKDTRLLDSLENVSSTISNSPQVGGDIISDTFDLNGEVNGFSTGQFPVVVNTESEFSRLLARGIAEGRGRALSGQGSIVSNNGDVMLFSASARDTTSLPDDSVFLKTHYTAGPGGIGIAIRNSVQFMIPSTSNPDCSDALFSPASGEFTCALGKLIRP